MVILMSFALAGCSVTGGGITGPATYWLVKVQGNYANVYQYPRSKPPWGSHDRSHAVYLGPTIGDERAHLSTAARSLGVPVGHISVVSP